MKEQFCELHTKWVVFRVIRRLCNRKEMQMTSHTNLTVIRKNLSSGCVCIGHFSCAIRTLCNGEEYFVNCTAANAKL
jgi:hypothetical protein